MHRHEVILGSVAVFALMTGAMVYLFARAGAPVRFIPDFLLPLSHYSAWFAAVAGQLPTLLHTYAFSLLTLIILGRPYRQNLPVSLSLWVTLEGMFEAGQHPAISGAVGGLIPAWLQPRSFFEAFESYFLYGTFDPLDMLAIVLAGLAAWMTVSAILSEESHDV